MMGEYCDKMAVTIAGGGYMSGLRDGGANLILEPFINIIHQISESHRSNHEPKVKLMIVLFQRGNSVSNENF